MKKIILLSLFTLILVASMFGAIARSYNQLLGYASGAIGSVVTNTSSQPSNVNYLATAYMVARPAELMSTANLSYTQIRVYQAAGTVMMFVQFGWFPTNWAVGDVLRCRVTLISTGEYTEWEYTIITKSGTITVTNPVQYIPAPVYNFTGTVTGDVQEGVTISCPGAYTPAQTTASNGTFTHKIRFWGSPVFTPSKDGFTFAPETRSYTNITAATANVNFVATAVPVGTPPSPATLVYPSSGATGLPFAGVTLQWASGDKNPATSYKVYFGTAPQLMIEVDDDADLFWATGVLLPDTWYYWKIIPYNGFGPATGVTTWSFQTRDALEITEATNPTPANNELIIVPVAPGFPYIVNLDWDSVHEGSATFDVFVMAPGELDYTLLTNFTNSYAQYPATLAGTYFWKVITYWTDPGTKNMPAASREIFDSKEAPNVWAFRLALEGTIPDIPADGSADVDGGPAAGGATVETDIDLWNQPIIPPEIIFVLAPIYNINDTIVLSYSGTGIGNITITVGPGTWWGAVYYNNNWHWADIPDRLSQPLVVLTGNTGEFVFNNVDFGAKGDVVFLLGEGDGPLPVEFSSFTAVVTSQYFVKLHWTTQTETNLAGYYVYRNTVNNLETATQFPQMISGTNTSQEANYSYVDKEVETGNTYYYWLQAVDMNNTHMFHGPISVEVTGQAAPVLPEISVLKNAYPNPLSTGNVNFNVEIRKGETGTVTVYNILGQAVKTFKVTEGKKTFTWDAKGVANGIYFYKLTTPTVTSAAKKLVILK